MLHHETTDFQNYSNWFPPTHLQHVVISGGDEHNGQHQPVSTYVLHSIHFAQIYSGRAS